MNLGGKKRVRYDSVKVCDVTLLSDSKFNRKPCVSRKVNQTLPQKNEAYNS